jgi:hypothetical protein
LRQLSEISIVNENSLTLGEEREEFFSTVNSFFKRSIVTDE